MTPGRVIVYDPNEENPGGAEIASVIESLSAKVRWLLPSGTAKSQFQLARVEVRPILAGPRPWTFTRLLRRLLGPMSLVLPVLRGHAGVIVWVHDAWDGFFFALLALVVPQRLYFIHNNPRSIRPRSGLAAAFEQVLVRRCHVIVHAEWLLDEVAKEEPHHVHIVAHPAYMATSALAPAYTPLENNVAYVGSLRRDKGASLLVDTLLSADARFAFRTIGRGSLTPDEVEALNAHGITYTATGGLDQKEFLEELSRVQVVVAPYLQPTESGSALLCMTMGIPMLALDSKTMRRILNENSLFCDTADLGAGLARFLRESWATYKITPEQQQESCKHDLGVALTCRTPFNNNAIPLRRNNC